MVNLLEKLSTEDYIRLEDETGLKNEYHGGPRGYGWVVAMSGVTEEHDLVATDISFRTCHAIVQTTAKDQL